MVFGIGRAPAAVDTQSVPRITENSPIRDLVSEQLGTADGGLTLNELRDACGEATCVVSGALRELETAGRVRFGAAGRWHATVGTAAPR